MNISESVSLIVFILCITFLINSCIDEVNTVPDYPMEAYTSCIGADNVPRVVGGNFYCFPVVDGKIVR